MKVIPANTESGQALIEWAVLLILYVLLMTALFAFNHWFAIRSQLLAVTREGGLLYSSGRMNRQEVKIFMQKSLQRGHPSLDVPVSQIYVGSSGDSQQAFLQLDKVSIRYRPTRTMARYFKYTLEESCVIKHAPQYGHPGLVSYGPPVPWRKTQR